MTKTDSKRVLMLRKLQEMEFVALDLNLYLDTHPDDESAQNDFNCAAETVAKLKHKYEDEYGPLLNFGFGSTTQNPWQWNDGPWPWEM
ncbi:MAG: spore coat protein CotJB [Sporomusaceae bacterium]|jgi:spore coat protein JB|nr:spore coat protein CotJB [Sporomusaceae bacterium]